MMNQGTIGKTILAIGAAVCVAALHAGAYVTNSIPQFWSFEGYADGSNIVQSLGWEGEEEAVKALLLDYPAPSHPINTTHTNVAELTENVTIHVDGSPYVGGTMWVDYLVRPKRWEEDERPGEIPVDTQLAMYVDSNGWLNVYHTEIDSGYQLLPPDWSVVDDPTYYIAENDWVRLSIGTDYSKGDGLAAYFQILLNGEPVRHAKAHYDPLVMGDYFAQDDQGVDDGELGAWFAMAYTDASQLNSVTLRGSGLFDDFVIQNIDPVVSNIFYYDIATSWSGEGSGEIFPELPGHGIAKVLPGADQEFSWVPAHDSLFFSAAITENGVTTTNFAESGFDLGYTFTNVINNGSVHIVFSLKDRYNIETAVSGGSISPTGTVQVIDGDNQTFTWSPSYGYAFTNVTIVENGATNVFNPGQGKDSGYTFNNVTNHGSVSVVFYLLPTLDITASATNGTIDPDGVVAVPLGYNRSFSWEPDFGFTFDSVTVVENNQTNIYVVGDGYDTGYPFNNVTNEGSIFVEFTELDLFTITASATNGTITPAGTTNVYDGYSASFTWEPDSGFEFSSVTVVENGATNTYDTLEYETGYVFQSVTNEGSIFVLFEEVPWDPGLLQWLLDTGLGTEFVMTEEAWAAYTASTDPNDPQFRFEVSQTWSTTGTNYVEWKSIYVDTNLPPFDIMRTTNAAQAFTWHTNYPRVAADTPTGVRTNVWWEDAPAFPVFYRIVATNSAMPVAD